MTRIVLASTSAYRRELLARLGIAFDVVDPAVDETPLPGEDPAALVARLARAKARSGARDAHGALVIGSDQVAVLDGEILGKPGDADTNRRQLERAAGRRVQFLTGVCLLASTSGREQVEVVPFAVYFRALSREQIAAYVDRERAFDCAGGFRCEGLGIALFERMEGDDPSALIGLPLQRLTRMLEKEGVDVLLQTRAADA
ncbi:MAG: septum formation inhibitor Maf [Gammaproteobacteria bacterium]|nr:septum formation inhibitor Maf [Gammaproteobacteria bacterium]NIM71809.1 septum formation inhibitor Maf [Gammaproteobacteria bacterium]NIN37931.1 septum formation inhibitor Maf [Gammaproteobacteria bacterium]NIO23565.1 septum formation inhibitor Maf [Gammaproteobacteria bacterium]NIO64181.1 septum formation inhibitor Maf [Gammaproteobacteria bacterium]